MGDYDQAESFARSALGRSTSFKPARELMLAIAQARNEPRLRLAVLHDIPLDDPQFIPGRLAEAELALQLGLAGWASSAWKDVLQRQPNNLRAIDGMILLSSVRLDREALRGYLLDRLNIATPRLQDVRLLLSLESLKWDSEAVSQQIRRWLDADPSDIDSRLSLARHALDNGLADEAIELLDAAPKPLNSQGRALLAEAYVLKSDRPQAEAILDRLPEQPSSGEYWNTIGQAALGGDDLPRARNALARAVSCRPLNREIRARFAECLRRSNDLSENQRQSAILDRLREISVVSQARDTAWKVETVLHLAELCELADANAEALNTYRYLLEMAPDHPTAKASVERCRQKLAATGDR